MCESKHHVELHTGCMVNVHVRTVAWQHMWNGISNGICKNPTAPMDAPRLSSDSFCIKVLTVCAGSPLRRGLLVFAHFALCTLQPISRRCKEFRNEATCCLHWMRPPIASAVRQCFRCKGTSLMLCLAFQYRTQRQLH